MQNAPLPIFLTRIGELELVNALQLRLFRGELRLPHARAAYAAFRADMRTGVFSVGALPEPVYAQATRLVQTWTARLGARTPDVIHVAAALVNGADTFITFDKRQKRLAKAAGVKTP